MSAEPVRHVKCFAFGRDDRWQALCVDFDLAVQGASLEEATRLLDAAVQAYVEAAAAEAPAAAARLLRRSAPLAVRAKLELDHLLSKLGASEDRAYRMDVALPCPA